ncbi:MAG TPA: hypothetical protein VEK84_14945 [Terriglobales bacterium]|nr:hypothetical protein [Terriglobales bacterium]
MGDLLEMVLEPVCDLIVMIIAAILGSMIFGDGILGSSGSRQGTIQTIFDGDPYFRNQSL